MNFSKIDRVHFFYECLSNRCVGPFPRIRMSFFLLSISTDELISAPNIITFFPVPMLGHEKDPCPSNPTP